MHVRVDERRREHEAGAVDDAVRVCVEAGADRGDHPVVDAHVHLSVDSFAGIESARAGDDQRVLRRRLADQRHATSSGVGAACTATGPCVSRS